MIDEFKKLANTEEVLDKYYPASEYEFSDEGPIVIFRDSPVKKWIHVRSEFMDYLNKARYLIDDLIEGKQKDYATEFKKLQEELISKK